LRYANIQIEHLSSPNLSPHGMADGEVIAYNISCFICALFLLEYGADKFIDHTAILARRTGVSETLISLLTAGAEWEEVDSKYIASMTFTYE